MIKQNLFKKLSYIIIFLNISTIICGIIYFIIPIYSIFWDIFGVLMVLTWILNFFLIYITGELLKKSNEIGKRINQMCYIFIVFFIIAMLLFVISDLLLSITTETNAIWLFLFVIPVYIGFFGISLFGIYFSYFNLKNLENRGVWKFE
ncbi:MAG: hypothetical protein ACTSQJ_17985 [Promethearchaeota archaeon]